MIFFSIGLPGVSSDWCDGLVLRGAGLARGVVDFTAGNSLEDVGLAVITLASPDIVVASRQPNAPLRAALAGKPDSFVILIADPRAAVADLVTRRGYALPAAVRAVASGAASILPLAAQPGALVLDAAGAGGDPKAAAQALCRHLGWELADSAVAAMVEALAAEGVRPESGGAREWWDSLPDVDRRLVDGALAPFAKPGPDEARRFVFEPPLFFLADDPEQAPTQPLDVTGRSRCLLYGPHIALPAGIWTAHVGLACAREAGGMGFLVEIFAGAVLAQTSARAPAGGGVFAASLTFAIQDGPPADQPFQVRVFNERAALDGRLALGKVTLVAQPRIQPEVGGDLARALGLAS